MASKYFGKVELIPWDYTSEAQVLRLYKQRIACGWLAEDVRGWVKASSEGRRIYYWVALTDQVVDRETQVSNHIAQYPKETIPLIDTANALRLTPRTPSGKQFTPIGHIAHTFNTPDEYEALGLPRSGVVTINQVYISHACQGQGFGQAAMGELEDLATNPPINASIAVLDTVVKEMQMDEWYDKRGLSRPHTRSQDWYTKLGYVIYKRGKKEEMVGGVNFALDMVYFKKDLRSS